MTGTATDIAGNTKARTPCHGYQHRQDRIRASTSSGSSRCGSYYFGSRPGRADLHARPTPCPGLDTCSVTGGGTAVGTTPVTATATDKAGNTAPRRTTYTVLAWTAKGFYSPVDMGGVLNTVKGGSTVPLKFELFAGSTELTDTSAVQSFTRRRSAARRNRHRGCDRGVTTGGTSLRYDTTGGQFIQNWKTPTGAGTCYTATMTSAGRGDQPPRMFKIK